MWSHLKEKSIILPSITSEEINKQVDPVLRKMEKNGIKIDVTVFGNLANKLESRLVELEKNIYQLSGEEFNINSPSQLADVLFGKLKLSVNGMKKTKTGISTAASELLKIFDSHPVIANILEYRELNKLVCTYLKPLPLLVDENSRLHTTYGQDTTTGRITSNEPNLQNIPIKGELGKKIRKAFVASPGTKLISADYSQIELRVVACLAEDKSMIEAFKNNEDVHTKTAAEIFHIQPEKVTPDHRRIAKSVNFGIVYGQSAYGLSQALKIDQSDAAKYISNYFDTHKGIKEYVNQMIKKAHEVGFVETLFGYKRYLPNINSHMRSISDSEERMAINTPVQGTAAEILKLAMIELDKKLVIMETDNPENCPRMLLTVHDELVVEAPLDQADMVAKLIKETMESVIKLCVPIVAEVGIGSNWSEAK